jgi:hypothetical protein
MHEATKRYYLADNALMNILSDFNMSNEFSVTYAASLPVSWHESEEEEV